MATPRQELENLRALAVHEGSEGSQETITPRQELEQLRELAKQSDNKTEPGALLQATQAFLAEESEEPGDTLPSDQQESPDAMEKVKGVLETLAVVGTGMTTGLKGRAEGFLKQLAAEISSGEFGTNAAADRIEKAALERQSELTFVPKTGPGKEMTKAIGKFGEALTPLGPLSGQLQPIASAASAPGQMTNIAVQNIISRFGNKPLLVDGKPVLSLRKALSKQGLDFNNLSPEAKLVIAQGGKNLTQKKAAQSAAEKAFVEEIKSGGKSDALAPFKVVNDKIMPDPLANKAIKQGFEPGTVQAIKIANPATKKKMRAMSDIMRQIKKQFSVRLDKRPSDIPGSVITDRIKFIRDKADSARLDLDRIAKTRLKGKEIDASGIGNQLKESLDDLDVTLTLTDKGVKADYTGSIISKDRTSQRVINDLIDLLDDNPRPDALRAHKLKRQLDVMIDFNKKSAEGLTEAGRNVLKDVRRSLNQSVRDVDSGYAKANDTLSQSLDALGRLDDAMGTIDIFGKGADKALGTRTRALLSNQQGRVRIENAIDDINATVENLGGKTTINVKDLIGFSDALDAKFGAAATTSLAGEIQKAASTAINQGAKGAIRDQVTQKTGAALERLRGVNDDAAFEAIHNLTGGK